MIVVVDKVSIWYLDFVESFEEFGRIVVDIFNSDDNSCTRR